MQRGTTQVMHSNHQANYMRATQASRSRHVSLDNKNVARQASLREWNFSGNVSRFATIGLVSRKKQSMIAHNTRRMQLNKRQASLLRGSGDKENQTSDLAQSSDLQTRLADRRNVKAKAKAAQKEIRLTQMRGAVSDEKLGLRTRGREPLLSEIPQNKNNEAGAGKK